MIPVTVTFKNAKGVVAVVAMSFPALPPKGAGVVWMDSDRKPGKLVGKVTQHWFIDDDGEVEIEMHVSMTK